MSTTESLGTSPSLTSEEHERAAKLATKALALDNFNQAQERGKARKDVYDTAYNILHPAETHPIAPVVTLVLKNEKTVTGRITGLSNELNGVPLSAISVSAIIDLNKIIIDDDEQYPVGDIANIDIRPPIH